MNHKKGKAYLVGAGPGDIGLITKKGWDILQKADVVIYDRLANPQLLNLVKSNGEKIYAGKKSSQHFMSQEDISRLIADKALEGKIVVRLKGGDPYVFGRGGEEAELLKELNIPFEIIPGITSGIGGLAYAGIPITHRDFASSLHLITGHKKEGNEELNFQALAQLDGTLVFYMGLENMESIANKLLEAGKKPDTKVALISNATLPEQVTITTNLQELHKKSFSHSLTSPVLIVIGDVVSLHIKLNFFEEKPLHGKKIIVTRARTQISSLREKLEELGGRVVESPSIEVIPINKEKLKEELHHLNKYQYVIFTSVNAVQIFMSNLMELYDSRSLANIKICSIGDATTKELQKWGIKPDIMPERYIGEALAEAVKTDIIKNEVLKPHILLTNSKISRNIILEILSEVASIHEIKIYDNIKTHLSSEELAQINGADYITFTSSSTVENFFELVDNGNVSDWVNAKLISIGPLTTEAIQKQGYKPHKTAKIHSIQGLVDAILEEENNENNETT